MNNTQIVCFRLELVGGCSSRSSSSSSTVTRLKDQTKTNHPAVMVQACLEQKMRPTDDDARRGGWLCTDCRAARELGQAARQATSESEGESEDESQSADESEQVASAEGEDEEEEDEEEEDVDGWQQQEKVSM